MKSVLRLDEVTKDSLPEVGGKTASLGELLCAGVRVPPGFALTTCSYQRFIAEEGIEDRMLEILSEVKLDEPSSTNDASFRLRALIEKNPMPEDVQEDLRKSYFRLCEQSNESDMPVAVRSSATAEDLPGASFAGQQESFLWVRGFDDLFDKVRKCWSSLFTSRAISYRIRMGFPHEKVSISVCVQKMVNSRSAGVMFTLNPINGDPSKIVIEGSWGLGESVVSGLVNPDRFEIDKVAWEITRSISHKTTECVFDAEKGSIVHREISPGRCDMPCIANDEELFDLAKTGKRIEKHYGCSQDIEWAIDNELEFPDNIFIVQSRPETVWSRRRKEPVGNRKSGLDLIMEKGVAFSGKFPPCNR